MKLSRSLILFLAVGLVTVFAVSVALKIFLTVKPSQKQTATLSYVLTPAKTDLKVGDKITVPVYLNGDNAVSATAFDVKIKFDATKLKLTHSTPGTFYDKYLTVKWDDKLGWYALAMSPTTPKKLTHPELPLLTLEFIAIGKSSSAFVTTDASTVYVAKTGGFHPQSGKTTFTIQ